MVGINPYRDVASYFQGAFIGERTSYWALLIREASNLEKIRATRHIATDFVIYLDDLTFAWQWSLCYKKA